MSKKSEMLEKVCDTIAQFALYGFCVLFLVGETRSLVITMLIVASIGFITSLIKVVIVNLKNKDYCFDYYFFRMLVFLMDVIVSISDLNLIS